MFNPDMLQNAILAAAEVGPDMTQAQKGGGDYTPPAAGPVRLRLISYIELGVHAVKGNPKMGIKDKDNELVALQFELSGPKHPPREDDKGNKYPQILNINQLNLSMNEKAGFFKLFKRLNHTGEYKHFAQLLGKPFMGTIVHNVVGEGADKKTYANLKDDAGYTIRPPYFETMDEEGNIVSMPVAVDEALSPLKCFIWNAPVNLKEMWDSLFIDGRYDDVVDDKGNVTKAGKSKNYWQNLIRSAKNFEGSPIAEIIGAGGEPDLSAGDVEKPDRSDADKQASADSKAGASEDPLSNIA